MSDPFPDPKPVVTIPDHELLRPIGRGSYGEVWLARTVLGEYRAVKIVRRAAFDRERPVERELEGIQKYEPISRSHENQVHILHVGRFEGGFYYVMELADPVTSLAEGTRTLNVPPPPTPSVPSALMFEPSAWSRYTPRTLRSDILARGRLPIGECLHVAAKLTDALAHLHGHGLVHRDVKPSNIIFVRGQPKLADIGLVATADSTLSCVGTEGFLPPEGPGRPQADLYALGKVLYEISTGRDRREFPELPTMLREDSQRRELEEFNEIILKACDPEPRRRYPTAVDMKEELELLRAGKSLQLLRRRTRQWAGLRRIAGVALAMSAIGVLPWLWRGRPTQTSRALPIRLSIDGASFWRTHFMPRQFDFSRDGQRVAFAGTNQLSIWERSTQMTRQLELKGLADWRIAGVRGALAMPRWAPDGRQIAFQGVREVPETGADQIMAYAILLVDVRTGEVRRVGEELAEAGRAADLRWRPDGQALIYSTASQHLVTLSLSGERTEWKDRVLPSKTTLSLGDISPDGEWLLVTAGSQRLQDTEGRDVWAIRYLGLEAKPLVQRAGLDAFPTWGPRGDCVVFVSAGARGRHENATWSLWKLSVDRQSMTPIAAPAELLARNGAKFLHPQFVGGGLALAYALEVPNTGVWHGRGSTVENRFLTARGQNPVVSPDGLTIYFVGERPDQQGVFAVSQNGEARSLRRVTQLTPLAGGLTRGGLSLSPDGRQLALFSHDGEQHGIYVVGTSGGESRLLEAMPGDKEALPVWSPDGTRLAFASDHQLITLSPEGRAREILAEVGLWEGWTPRWSPDGRYLAAMGYATREDFEKDTNHVAWVVAVADKQLRRLTPATEPQYKEGLEWHPSGEYLTYMVYGPKRFDAQIRRAYPDGRPTELMIQQPDHWDYLGVWAPDGRHFYFISSTGKRSEKSIHGYDAQTGEITHGLWGGGLDALPQWSADGSIAVWAGSETQRYFEWMEDFQP